jgi:hypothetical protein
MQRTIPSALVLTTLLVAGSGDDIAVVPKEIIADPHTVDAITIPRILSYQGKLTDTMGVPVRDTVWPVQFRLYTQPTGGSHFWEENQAVRTDEGLFSVMLGSSTPIPAVPDAGALFLSMKVGAEPEMMPRIRIVSTPYAFLAEDARHADTADYAVATVFPDSVAGDFAIGGELRGYGRARIGTDCYLAGTNSFVAGYRDSVTGNSSVVSGGSTNRAGAHYTTVCGGYLNRAMGLRSTVVGGLGNEAPGVDALVCAGRSNIASDSSTAVVGGYSNAASGNFAFVGGGDDNSANEHHATVGGGGGNQASEPYATVGGGSHNQANGYGATVAGGYYCSANGYGSVASGYGDSTGAHYCAALSGRNNTAGDGPTDTAAVVVGGLDNAATRPFTFVGGGRDNAARLEYAVVVGGEADSANGAYSSVLGGYKNLAGDGTEDTAATVGGGWNNDATGPYATVGGGRLNNATGRCATVPGGLSNDAMGSFSMAGGEGVDVNTSAHHTFAFGNSFATSTPNAFVLYNGGATKIGIDVVNPSYVIDIQDGAYCTGTNWVNASERGLMKNTSPLSTGELRAVLEELNGTSVVRYQYESEDTGEEHIGLIAEDAPEAIATPAHDGINTADAIGWLVAIAKAQQAEIESLKARLEGR